MTLSKPEQMLLQAVSAALRGAEVGWTEKISDDDWTEFFSLAQAHKVLPLVYEAVYDCKAAEGVPLVALCRQDALRAALTQTAKSSAFLSLWEMLSRQGLHPLVVKGIVCRAVYPNGDCRSSSDEDLLIPDREWADCCRVLREYGMTPVGSDDLMQHEIGWEKGLLYIELHRSLFPPENGAYGELNRFFSAAHERASDYAVEEEKTVRSLCPQDHLLYLLLHAYKHFIHSGFGIRQVCDIGLWALRYEREIDWDELYGRCEEARALTFSAAVFHLAQKYLAIPLVLPEKWRGIAADPEPMLRDLLSGGVYGATDMSRLHSGSVTVNAVAADRQKGRRSLLTSVFPPREQMSAQYPELKNHPGRLPVVWIKRLLKYAKETHAAENNRAGEALRIAKERTELLRLYGIIE